MKLIKRTKHKEKKMQNLIKKLGLSILVASSLYGATPTTINYQGYLTDSSDTPITGSKSIEFKIYDVLTGGTALWTSAKTITVTDGVYSTVLGDTVALTGLEFNTTYYLGINVASDGEMSPRVIMTNTAYADVFRDLNSSDLNVVYLDTTTEHDNNPATLSDVKALLLNWTLNGSLTESPPTLLTGITHNGFTYNEVYEPTTKRIWLDRNIGASQACTTHNDATSSCFGDYFQWGRGADGHEKSNSSTTTTIATTLSPGHSSFIKTTGTDPNLWTTASLTAWDGTANDVCPTGYSIPTYSEWGILTGSTTLGFLKLADASYRDNNGVQTGYSGLWLGTSVGTGSSLKFYAGYNDASTLQITGGYGLPIRCIKDQ